jgi:hypothetical protein
LAQLLGPQTGLEASPNSFGVPASRNTQIFGLAAICWVIWKLRNKACFEKKA